MSVTSAAMLSAVEDAILRLINGAKFVTVNGQQMHFSSLGELKSMRADLRREIAEDAGTEGRGAWEATFRE